MAESAPGSNRPSDGGLRVFERERELAVIGKMLDAAQVGLLREAAETLSGSEARLQHAKALIELGRALVELHLTRTYRKLGIDSREGLSAALTDDLSRP